MDNIDVLLLCALKDEYDQVINVTDGLTEKGWVKGKDKSGRTISDGKFLTKENTLITIRATWLAYMGREQAQAVASSILKESSAKCIAMSGICAGRKGKLELGDVIFADRLWSYDSGKTTKEGEEQIFQADILQYAPPEVWVHLMQDIEPYLEKSCLDLRPSLPYEHQEDWVLTCLLDGEDPRKHTNFNIHCPDWTQVIRRLWQKKWLEESTINLTSDGRSYVERLRLLHPTTLPTPKQFQIHVAPIATGASVQEDDKIFDRLAAQVRKVLGLDMEASGIAALAQSSNLTFIVAKGVSDYGDAYKDDRYRYFAARASAELLIRFLRKNAALFRPTPENSSAELISHYLGLSLNQEAHINSGGEMHLDEIATDELNIIKKSRFFIGYKRVEAAEKLAQKVKNGTLSGVSKETKSIILAWCSRFLAKENFYLAEDLLSAATQNYENEYTTISTAFLDWSKGEFSFAISALTKLNTPTSYSAALVIMTQEKNPEEAINWALNAKISMSDLSSEGKFTLLQNYFLTNRISKVLELANFVDDNDIDNTPALLYVLANANLALAVPDELRIAAFHQPSLDAKHFGLFDTNEARNYRKKAISLYERLSLAAEKIQLQTTAQDAIDKALWLRLRDPQLHESALNELKESMSDDASSLRRLHLAIQFGIKIDYDALKIEIDKQIALSGGNSELAEKAKFLLELNGSDVKDIANYMSENYERLIKVYHQGWIDNIYVQILIHADFHEKAKEIIDRLKSNDWSAAEAERLEHIILEKEGHDISESLIVTFEKSQSIIDLERLVRHLTQKNDITLLGKYLPILFDKEPRVPVLNQYATLIYNQGADNVLETLLTENLDLVEQSEHLQLIRANLFHNLGNFSSSINLLNELRAANDQQEYRTLYVRNSILSGEWEALTNYIEKEWDEREHRIANDLIQTTLYAVALKSPRVKGLLEYIVEKNPSNPQIIASCYSIATSAGLDGQLNTHEWLNSAIEQSDETGPLQSISLAEITNQQTDWVDRSANIWKMVEQGILPLIGLSSFLNRSLCNLTLTNALQNLECGDPRKKSLIPAYSGMREVTECNPKTISVDPIALLTMEFLGITETVVNHFDKVFIPLTTLGWMFEESRKINYHQPSLITRSHQLLKLLTNKSVEEITSLQPVPMELVREVGEDLALMLNEAKIGNLNDPHSRCYVVHSFPIHKAGTLMETMADTSSFDGILCSCYAILSKLREKACITEQQESQYINYLQAVNEGSWVIEPQIADNSIIYLDYSAIQNLDHLKLIPKLKLAGLKVYINNFSLNESKSFIELETQANQTLEHLDNLRIKLRNSIRSNKVKAISTPRKSKLKEKIDTLSFHPGFSIFELPVNCDAIVVDDRCLNKHTHIDLPNKYQQIISTLDILKILENGKKISAIEHAEHRTKLRQGGYALIQLEPWELELHLKKASVIAGKLVENTELKAIRENLLEIRMSDVLQLPEEFYWFNSTLFTCFKAIKQQWREEIDTEISIAKSNWLRKLMDVRGWAHRFDGHEPDAQQRYQGTLVALMISPTEQPDHVRKKYMQWVDVTVLQPIQETDKPLYENLVAQALEMFTQTMDAPLLGDDDE